MPVKVWIYYRNYLNIFHHGSLSPHDFQRAIFYLKSEPRLFFRNPEKKLKRQVLRIVIEHNIPVFANVQVIQLEHTKVL